MAQKPLSEMAYTGYENHSEEYGFMHEQWMQDRIALQEQIEKCATKEEWIELWNYVTSQGVCVKDFNSCITAISIKLDAANEAIKAMADKLDAEDVANLDTDYRATVDAEIK